MSIPSWKPSEADPTPDIPRKRVAMVGFAASSLHLVPWHDPAYELWGMNQAYGLFERTPDRWFEIHQPDIRLESHLPTYLSDLRQLTCPIYMIDVDPHYPRSVRYPLERVQAMVPPRYRRYFTSSIAYMVALAMLEGFETIALYGIDCATGGEYEFQKPCLEAWCSLAEGRGHEIIIPPTSSLFKSPFMYGYEAPRAFPRVLKASEQFLRNRINDHKTVSNTMLAEMHRIEGAINELESLISFAEAGGRGAQYPTVEGQST